jgi:TonB family protein
MIADGLGEDWQEGFLFRDADGCLVAVLDTLTVAHLDPSTHGTRRGEGAVAVPTRSVLAMETREAPQLEFSSLYDLLAYFMTDERIDGRHSWIPLAADSLSAHEPPGCRDRGAVVQFLDRTSIVYPATSLALADADLPEQAHCRQPPYPRALRHAGIEGRALVEFVVDTSGHLEGEVTVLDASHRQFGDAAKKLIRTCQFHPGRLASRPIRVLMRMPVNFVLSGKEP